MLRRLPSDHRWLIEKMKSLDYKSDPAGICYGLACMLVQAILANDLHTFNYRLRLIASIENLSEAIEKAKKIPVAARSFEDRELLNILAFFEGIELHHKAALEYQDWFPEEAPFRQSAKTSFDILAPTTLDEVGISEVSALSCIGNPNELTALFDSLAPYFSALLPAAGILSSHDHAIMFGYDDSLGCWYLGDTNDLEELKYYPATEDLVAVIFDLFEVEKLFSFSINMFVLTPRLEEANELLFNWYNNPTVRAILTPTPLKAAFVDDKKIPWVFMAVQDEEVELVESLLRRGADVNFRLAGDDLTARKESSLLLESLFLQNRNLVEVLLKHKVDVNAPLNNKVPFLYALSCSREIRNLLIAYGANINAFLPAGETILTFLIKKHASPWSRLPEIDRLLRHNANSDLLDKNGDSPLGLAVNANFIRVAKKLLIHGANPDLFSTQEGMAPLHRAISHDNKEMVELLLSYSANIEILYQDPATERYFTPLQWAVQFGSAEMVATLLQYSGNPSNPNDFYYDELPLIGAIKARDLAKINLLLQAGSDPLLPGAKGVNALEVASKIRSREIVALLKHAIQSRESPTELSQSPNATMFSRKRPATTTPSALSKTRKHTPIGGSDE